MEGMERGCLWKGVPIVQWVSERKELPKGHLILSFWIPPEDPSGGLFCYVLAGGPRWTNRQRLTKEGGVELGSFATQRVRLTTCWPATSKSGGVH